MNIYCAVQKKSPSLGARGRKLAFILQVLSRSAFLVVRMTNFAWERPAPPAVFYYRIFLGVSWAAAVFILLVRFHARLCEVVGFI